MADTITAYHSFSAGTKARSSQVNTNFSNHRGTLVPIDPNTATAVALTYDLGTTEYRWRDWYGRGLNLIGMTTTANLTLTRDNAVTGGAFDLAIGGTTSTMRIEQGLIKTQALSRTIAATTTGASAGAASIIAFGSALNNTRIDTTTTFTLASTRFNARAGTIVRAMLLGTNVSIIGPTLPAAFTRISMSISINRGATTTAMTQIGTVQFGLQAHGITTGAFSQHLQLIAPGALEVWDNSFTAGEVVYEAVGIGNDAFMDSGTTALVSGFLGVTEL